MKLLTNVLLIILVFIEKKKKKTLQVLITHDIVSSSGKMSDVRVCILFSHRESHY